MIKCNDLIELYFYIIFIKHELNTDFSWSF